jgi:hypothetical protein
MDIDLVQAQWTLGRFPRERLPSFAAEAMVQGFDGPRVLDLASYDRPSFHLLTREVVVAAFQEMGRPPLTEDRAAEILARDAALRLLRNQISTDEGAAEMLHWMDRVDYRDLTQPVMHLMAQLRERELNGRELKQIVIELAWELVNEGSAP